jgi:hypothetical protein
MKTIETTSARNDLLIAILAGVQIALILAWNSWPLRVKDVVIALIWAVVLGIAGTIAVLKHNGTIQVRQPSPEDTDRLLKRKGILMIITVVVAVIGLTWILMR